MISNNFKKSDLKSGDKILYRDEDCDERYVLLETETIHSKDGQKQSYLKYYNNDLIDNNHKSQDIMKVYRNGGLLWERKEIIKITEDEKVILRNIDNRYKYIARDKNNELWVFDGKPRRDKTIFTSTEDGELEHLAVFQHMLKTITFKNSPHLIEDLIKD